MHKRPVSLVAALAILLLFCIMPTPEGLSRTATISLGLLLAGILLWITEVMPLAISALLLMVLMPYLGIMNFATVWAKFISSVIFFVIAAFGLTIALLKTSIPLRITATLMQWSGTNAPKLVLGFMFCTALVSTIVTNTADCALFMGLALSLLKANNAVPGKSNLGKCLMIGVPLAAMLGGGVTPAGVSINIMAMNMFSTHTGITISFFDWIVMGLPMCMILLPICWWCLVKTFKPEEIAEESLQAILEQAEVLGPMNIVEKKVLTILALLLVLWVSSTWVPAIDATAVAVFGLVVMFFPGVDLLTFDELSKGVSWNIILMIGGVQSLASGILSTGAAAWLVETAMAVVDGGSNVAIMAGASTFVAFLHVIIPVGTAIVGMTTIPLADLAAMTGISPVAMTVMLAFLGSISFVLPIDCVPIITYSLGYYKMIDMIKVGWFPTIVLIAYCTLVLPVLSRMLGY